MFELNAWSLAMKLRGVLGGLAAGSCLLVMLPAHAQSLTFAEVQASGAKRLTAAEIKQLVSGSTAEFIQVNGRERRWKSAPDGTFIASRNFGEPNRRSGQGSWRVNDDEALCLDFDWGAMQTDGWCRQVYQVDDRYYMFGLKAKPETLSGRYRFSK